MEQYIDTEYLEQDKPDTTVVFGEPSGGLRRAYLCWLVLATFIAFAIYLGSGEMGWEFNTKIGIIFGFIVFIGHFVYRALSRPINWLAPDLVYVLAYFLFHFGYLVLWLFGIVPYSEKIFFHLDLYPKVMFIVNLGMISFLIGYEIFIPRKPHVTWRRMPTESWILAGLTLMFISIIIHITYILVVGVQTFLAEGYSVSARMHTYVRYPRLWALQPLIFSLGFGIYLVSVALRHRRLLYGKFGITIFVIYFTLLLLEGGRTQLIIVGMVLLLVRHYLIKPVKLKWLAMWFVLAMTAFASIAVVRNIAAFDPAKMKKELAYAREMEQLKWYSPLVEMGGSVGTVNLMTYLIPGDQPYWHGRSYVQAITHTIPFMQTILAPYLGVGPAQWLTYTLFGYGAAGTGFSIAGEGYLNFGLPGVFFHMIFMGFLFRRIYTAFTNTISPSRALVFIVFFGIMIISVRNHTNLIFAPLARILFVVWVLKSVCGEEVVPVDYEQLVLYEQEYSGRVLTYE